MMRFARSVSLAALILAACGLNAPVRAADALTAAQKAQVETLIHDYILAHPEIVEEAIDAAAKKKDAEKLAAQQSVMKDSKSAIFQSKHNVVLGNPDGKKTIVEFFDYNCGYCKRAFPDMVNLIESDKNIRFVLKEFPVLGAGSVEAAQVAVAINRLAPEKYMEFHKRMVMTKGEANKARALEAAASVGVEAARIVAELNKPDANDGLKETFGIADALGINGTPSYIIGEAIIPGAVGIERLKAQLDKATP